MTNTVKSCKIGVEEAGKHPVRKMEAYFADLPEKLADAHFLRSVCKKYHYQDEDYESLCSVAESMLPLVRGGLCMKHRLFAHMESMEAPDDAVMPERYPAAGLCCAEAAITLGEGLDKLQAAYMENGRLSECYMVEALASELLLQAYTAYNRYVAENTDYHVARYHFLGSEPEYPMDMLPDMLMRLDAQIVCNEAFCMLPKKSVAFVAELTNDETIHCRGICIGCNSRHCPNRMDEGVNIGRLIADMTDVPMSYGYSRIFGRR